MTVCSYKTGYIAVAGRKICGQIVVEGVIRVCITLVVFHPEGNVFPRLTTFFRRFCDPQKRLVGMGSNRRPIVWLLYVCGVSFSVSLPAVSMSCVTKEGD